MTWPSVRAAMVRTSRGRRRRRRVCPVTRRDRRRAIPATAIPRRRARTRRISRVGLRAATVTSSPRPGMHPVTSRTRRRRARMATATATRSPIGPADPRKLRADPVTARRHQATCRPNARAVIRRRSMSMASSTSATEAARAPRVTAMRNHRHQRRARTVLTFAAATSVVRSRAARATSFQRRSPRRGTSIARRPQSSRWPDGIARRERARTCIAMARARRAGRAPPPRMRTADPVMAFRRQRPHTRRR
jgi:hypothetical protein